MSQLSDSELEKLQSRLLPFASEWTARTGRQLASARDAIDFLAAMKGRAEFWSCLAPQDPMEAHPIDPGALRALLPSHALGADVPVEDYLRSVGLTEAEARAVIHGLDDAASLDGAIRAAFAEGRPQAIARALERLLETNSDIVATQSYVSRFARGSGIARTMSTMMGIALLLLGTACGPTEPAPSASPQIPTRTAPAPSPAPTPAPAPLEPPIATSPAPAPEPVPPTPASDPEPTPRPPRPNRPPRPAPRYKGVSPRSRAGAPRSASDRDVPT